MIILPAWMGKHLMSVSMAYLRSEGLVVNAGQDRAFQDKFASALDLHNPGNVDIAGPITEQHSHDHVRTEDDHSLSHNNQQHDPSRRNKHTDERNFNHHGCNYSFALWTVGSTGSYAGDGDRSGPDPDDRRRGGDQKKA